MGEYLQSFGNDGEELTGRELEMLAEIMGVPGEKIDVWMVIARVENADGRGMSGLMLAGNIAHESMPYMLHGAFDQLVEAMQDEAIAASVPDDISGLVNPGEQAA